jgi:hypothetical protein
LIDSWEPYRPTKEVVSKLQSLLPLANSRADDVKRLRNEGYVSEDGMPDREQIRIETERELALQLSRAKEVKAAIFESSQRRGGGFVCKKRAALRAR